MASVGSTSNQGLGTPVPTASVPVSTPSNEAASKENNVSKKESSSCFGRFWSHLKNNGPEAVKVCAVAFIQFCTTIAALAGAVSSYVALEGMCGSTFLAFSGALPVALGLVILAKLISNASIHALGLESYREKARGPFSIFI